MLLNGSSMVCCASLAPHAERNRAPVILPPPPHPVKKKEYDFGKTLGEGTFGIVRSALWKTAQPPIRVAVKVIAKKNLKGNDQLVADEMDVMKGLDQPHVVKFLDWFESKDKVRVSLLLLHAERIFERRAHTWTPRLFARCAVLPRL